MLGPRLSEEQIVQILNDVESGQLTVNAVCHLHEITEDTLNRWKYMYGGMKTPTQRVHVLEQENIQLKQQLAEREQELQIVKETLARYM